MCGAVLLLAGSFSAVSQVPSQEEKVRIAIWAERDAYPALLKNFDGEEADKKDDAVSPDAGEWDYPKAEIKRVAKFMVGGMAAGWTFEYTPSDKRRGVEEYFSIEDIRPLGEDAKGIDYTQVWVEGGKVWCWIEFNRTERMKKDYSMWQKIDHAASSGVGYAGVEGGFEGVVEAARLAVRDAVRSRYRAIVKNKPRCITGRVLVRNPPRVGISSGRYKVALDFFMETDTIDVYKVF